MMNKFTPNAGSLRAVADRLDKLGLDYAFTDGSIVSFLLDNPGLSPVRATDDVDVILEVVANLRYSAVEAKLRELNFEHDMTPDAPMCRWKLGTLVVDIMPVEGARLGLNTKWFKEALETAKPRNVGGTLLRLISPAALLATKHMAFADRGNADYYGSHDLEDFITVVDGRAGIVGEINQSPEPLRAFVIEAVRKLLDTPAFDEALPGHLPSDSASQKRLPSLRAKLRAIENLR